MIWQGQKVEIKAEGFSAPSQFPTWEINEGIEQYYLLPEDAGPRVSGVQPTCWPVRALWQRAGGHQPSIGFVVLLQQRAAFKVSSILLIVLCLQKNNNWTTLIQNGWSHICVYNYIVDYLTRESIFRLENVMFITQWRLWKTSVCD